MVVLVHLVSGSSSRVNDKEEEDREQEQELGPNPNVSEESVDRENIIREAEQRLEAGTADDMPDEEFERIRGILDSWCNELEDEHGRLEDENEKLRENGTG